MNNNSMSAFKSERDNGNITKRQQQVVDFLHLVKGATAKQITKAVPNGWKRCSELVALGLVRVCGNVKDRDTKKMVSVYELTGQQMLLPTPSVKRPSRKELEDRINELNIEVLRMKGALTAAYETGLQHGRLACIPQQQEIKCWWKIW